MDQPNYVLRSMENMRMPKNEKINSVKKVILVIIALLILGSFVFGSNLFGELSWTAQILLFSTAAGTIFAGGSKFVAFPIELWFYDDRIAIYRDFVYYGKNKKRKEMYVFQYNDIEECTFDKVSSHLKIKGQVYVEWFNYDKSGTVSQKPDIAKKELGLCYFYTNADPNVDFVKEIQKHSPIHITLD